MPELDPNLLPELVASRSETRWNLGDPYFDAEKGRVIATDGHALVVLPVEGDGPSRYLAPADLAALRGNPPVDPATFQERRFPDWEKVIPPWKEGDEGTVSLAFDVVLLDRIARAIGAVRRVHEGFGSGLTREAIQVVLTIKPGDLHNPVRVRPVHEAYEGGPEGFLMPVKFDPIRPEDPIDEEAL